MRISVRTKLSSTVFANELVIIDWITLTLFSLDWTGLFDQQLLEFKSGFNGAKGPQLAYEQFHVKEQVRFSS